MKKMTPIALLLFLGLWVQPALAYIDPGSGSAIMSAIIGAFVASGLVIKTYWYKLKSLFGSKTSKSEIDSEPTKPDR